MSIYRVALALMALTPLAAAPVPAPVKVKAPPVAAPAPAPAPYTDLTDDFARLADDTRDLSEAERVRRFHALFDPLVPGLYNNKGAAQAKFDTIIAQSIKSFPKERAAIAATAASFTTAFETREARFRAFFPDYRQRLPVYLIHSINQMDGGTRTINGRTTLLFGAEMIARIHDESTIGPLLDHELFHSYHARFFRGCNQLWCSLWIEGLAVYVAQRMNPGATDRQLLLTLPEPIRPAVEPRLSEAMCAFGDKMTSTGGEDYAEYFNYRTTKSRFPARTGYYLGLVIADKVGRGMPITRLATLPRARVLPLMLKAMASYGPCPPRKA